MKKAVRISILAVLLGVSFELRADILLEQQRWDKLAEKTGGWRNEERVEGISYVVSGSLVTLGSISGFYSTSDPFGKAVFSTTQILGIGAVGYGLRKLILGHELIDTYYLLDTDPTLSPGQKAEVFYRYHQQWRARQRQAEIIDGFVYALSGAVTLYNASQIEAGPSKNALYGLAALSIALSLHKTF